MIMINLYGREQLSGQRFKWGWLSFHFFEKNLLLEEPGMAFLLFFDYIYITI